MPQPDGWYELRTPWWWETTVVAWVERREQANDKTINDREQK